MPGSPVLVGAAVIVLAFLFGGSARADVTSLLWLRPLSIFFLAWAVWTARLSDLREHKFLFTMAIAIVAVVALALIPLPPAVWQLLPGREIIVEIDRAAGIDPSWRPLSMTPRHTLNALYSLALPAALLLILARLDETELLSLLPVVTIMLALSVLIGMLQAAGLPIHLYQIDNPVAGLFANRNHQGLAIACFLPLIAVLATREARNTSRSALRRNHLILLAAVIAIIPLVFVIGSRAGLALAGLSLLIAGPLWLSSPLSILARGRALLLFGSILVAAVGIVAMVLVASDRNLVLQRLVAKNMSNELRIPIWRTTADLGTQYMPFGSGPGSFVEIFQITERTSELVPQYVNHAHNDFLEVALTTGVAGVVLIAIAVTAFAICTWRLWRSKGSHRETLRYRWLGLGLVALCAAASLVDYPLRTPALACLFVFAAFLASGARSAQDGRGLSPKGSIQL